MKLARELDIYIDEIGDQSVYSADNPLYIVSFVCVESCSLNDGAIKNFHEKLSKLNGGNHFVHTGNLVRKERPYKELIVEERQSLFGCMFFLFYESEISVF